MANQLSVVTLMDIHTLGKKHKHRTLDTFSQKSFQKVGKKFLNNQLWEIVDTELHLCKNRSVKTEFSYKTKCCCYMKYVRLKCKGQ